MPLTDEEADIKMAALFQEAGKHISDFDGIELTHPETFSALDSIRALGVIDTNFSRNKDSEYAAGLAKRVNETGADWKMCDVAIHLYRKGYKHSENDTKLYSVCVGLLMDFTDHAESTVQTIVKHPDFLSHVRESLVTNREDFLGTEVDTPTYNILDSLTAIVHNIVMKDFDGKVLRLRDERFTEALIPYLKLKHEEIVLATISTLAEIINEEESERFLANTKAVEFLINTLRAAINSPTRRAASWSSHELTAILRRLARNDTNKKTLVDIGALPVLLDQIKSGTETSEDELTEAIQAIWALSFDEDNKSSIVNTDGLIDRIINLKEKSTAAVQHACNGILMTLRDTLKNIPKYSDAVKEYFLVAEKVQASMQASKAGSTPETDESRGHVMISYQWSNQTTLIELCKRLKADEVPVWMDIDDMGGSTLQAMAEAVENADVILMCMSQKYKDSPNCRAEAEYAFQNRKTIIPLIMENRYRPDGWLGLILGSKLYYDFSGENTFEAKVLELLKAVRKIYRNSCMDDEECTKEVRPVSNQTDVRSHPQTAPITSAFPSQHPVKSESDETVKQWTTDDVKAWARENNWTGITLEGITGEELLYIKNLQYKAPEFFYRVLREDMKLTHIRDVRLFENALNTL